MRTRDAIKYAGSRQALADLLGCTLPAIYQWKAYPPGGRQLQIEVISGGALKAEPGCMDPKPKPKGRRNKRKTSQPS